jgi:phage tail-like protein
MYFGTKSTWMPTAGEVVKHRSGGDPSTSHKSPGRNKYEPITLERGVTQDQSFSSWASQVWNYGSGLGAEVSLANYRKGIVLEFYNEAGQLVVGYKIGSSGVSEFPAQGGTITHHLKPDRIEEQLAAIFEKSLRKAAP